MINTWIEVEMKKFRLFGYMFVDDKKEGTSIAKTVGANSYADVIQEIESNAGWITETDCAFKVAYIEKVVE
ncbi:hypothetical protein [Lactococcus lactis]|uniref:hypothetical protein n=1 Tax=Lactococcus lactis TaxID=1358 RepID=UPI0028936C3A|nr:hypothetical protein [Lactococcus lactis]